VPCKKEFPHLVQLHQKYAKDGLVAMSVSVDTAEDRGKALEFLRKQSATFANFWLDEKGKVWQEKLDIAGPPAVFVFDRQGKRAGKFDTDDPDKPYTYDDIEKLVRQLLKAP
jgi:hypothetical protein